MLGERAYHGYRGWYLAKAHAQNGQKTKAFALYAGAVSRGCYSPPMAARILLQIALVNGGYRRIADFVIGKHLSKGADSQVR